jgi:hypothetical protein
MPTQRRTIAQRVNDYLVEPPGEQFVNGKWRFWFLAVAFLAVINSALTWLIFRDDSENYSGPIMLSVGALVAWLCVGALHYSDSTDRKLARGVSAIDSFALIFVVVHFSGLLYVYGHHRTLRSAEAKYEAQAAAYNAKTEKISEDNAKISADARQIEIERTKRARIENDTVYQAKLAAKAGAKVQTGSSAGGIAPSLSTAPIELEKPQKPAESSVAFLTKWDWLIRLANCGELLLACLTLIVIRNVSAKSNSPVGNYPTTVGDFSTAAAYRSPILQPRLDQRRTSDNERQSLSPSQNSERLSLSEPDRKDALKRLREHLKAIAFYHPNRWFKADLVRGGVTIRFFKRDHGHEIAIAETTQSDKLLAAVDRPDFREKLLAELLHQGFPLEQAEE